MFGILGVGSPFSKIIFHWFYIRRSSFSDGTEQGFKVYVLFGEQLISLRQDIFAGDEWEVDSIMFLYDTVNNLLE